MAAHKPNFKFGTFIKLLSLNTRPQSTEVRKRLRPTAGGRDYHDSLRHRIRHLVVDGESEAAVFASLNQIKQAPERNSAELGLTRIIEWRRAFPGDISRGTAIVLESPDGYYAVKYSPDFVFRAGDLLLPVVVYNNKSPRPEPRLTCAALHLASEAYRKTGLQVADLALLDLQTLRLHRLSEVPGIGPVADRLLPAIDRLFERAKDERERPPGPGPFTPGLPPP